MYEIGVKIKTKKKHPCGGDVWTIIRNGADYKIKCDTCNRTVILSPDELKKRTKILLTEEKNEK